MTPRAVDDYIYERVLDAAARDLASGDLSQDDANGIVDRVAKPRMRRAFWRGFRSVFGWRS